MVIGKEYQSIIYKIFNGDVKNYLENEQIQINCPRCQKRDNLAQPDGRYNLEINSKKRVFKCWKCDNPKFYGSLGKLIKLYGNLIDYELYKSYGGLDYFYDIDGEEIDYDIEVEISLPKEYIPFSKMDIDNPSHVQAYMYMVNERKISLDTLKKFKVGFCLDGDYANRIIIPSFNPDMTINYFVARSYTKSKLPYKNPDVKKDFIIFNDGLINWDSTIYIVEGVFEMFRLYNAIPQLGKEISKKLIYKLKRKKPNVIVLFDPDANHNAITTVSELKQLYGNDDSKVKIVKMTGNDDLDEIVKKNGRKEMIENVLFKNCGDLTVDDNLILKNSFFNEKKYVRH